MSPSETDSATKGTLATVEQFNDVVNRHDIDGMMAVMTDDCIFDNTRPAPDGERLVGQSAVRAFFTAFFARSPAANFETEEIFACGDRCVVRWVYRWVREGVTGHVRGVDVFKVRGGKVAEKLSYVKG